MKDKKEEEFLKVKGQIIDNLTILQVAISRYTDEGMIDLESSLYNKVVDLLDETHAMEELNELENIVYRAKNIETTIDMWLSSVGRDNMELHWPTFRPII